MKQTQNPKNILYITLSSIITSVARRSSLEGHCVKYYIEDEKDQEVGDGFLDKVNNPDDRVDWADLIVFDDVLGQGKKAQSLRKQGKLVIGGTEYTDMLEDDKNFGQSEMKKHGIKILDYKEYHTFDEAIADIKKNPGKYVLKPSGEAQNIKRLLFVGQEDDGSDVIKILKAYRETWSEEVKVFQLQKKVTSGVEIAVGAFFNGKKFLTPLNINFEHKKLFPGELGVATGEMGTSMFWTGPNKLFNLTLKKFESTLAKEGYVGYIDINCIVNGSGIYPLEFTCRFGCPTIAIQSDGIVGGIGDFFYTLAAGTTHEFKYKKGFTVGARVVVPPFPYNDPKTYAAFGKDAVIVRKKQGIDGYHLEDTKLVDGQRLTTGGGGRALTVTGSGITMDRARHQMYERIKNVMIPNMYYRSDIGERRHEDSDKLHTRGYLREI